MAVIGFNFVLIFKTKPIILVLLKKSYKKFKSK